MVPDTEKLARKALLQWNGRNPRLGILRTIHQTALDEQPDRVRMVSHTGQALLSAELCPDGTIRMRSPDQDIPGACDLPFQDPSTLRMQGQRSTWTIIKRLVATSITETIIRQAGEQQTRQVRDELQAQAILMAGQEAETSDRLITLHRRFIKAVSEMADPELVLKLNRIIDPGPPRLHQARPTTLWHYCTAVRLGDSLDHLIRTNPGPLSWLLKNQQDGPEIRHPGQIIMLARKSLAGQGLRPESWRTCTRISLPLMENLLMTNRTRNAASIINSMAAARVIPTEQKARDAMMILEDANREQQPGQSLEENTRDAIVLLLRRREEKESYENLTETMDYIKGVSREGQRITARTWGGLKRRSQEWHETEAIRNAQRMIQEGELLTWKSLLTRVESGDLQADALGSNIELALETARMRHCAADYSDSCIRGGSRIFSISRRGKKVATMEIVLQDDAWSVRQVQGPMNSDPGQEAVRFAKKVATQYNRAWRAGQE